MTNLYCMVLYLGPWTSDNKYIATDRTLAAMYDMSPKDKKVWDDHGIHFFFDNHFHRVCVTPTFMKGRLAKLWTWKSHDWYPLVYPYADILIARETLVNNTSVMIDQLRCAHCMENIRPAQRRGVYQNSFQVSMPNNAEEVLKHVYGSTWRIPDAKKKPHGNTRCGLWNDEGSLNSKLHFDVPGSQFIKIRLITPIPNKRLNAFCGIYIFTIWRLCAYSEQNASLGTTWW